MARKYIFTHCCTSQGNCTIRNCILEEIWKKGGKTLHLIVENTAKLTNGGVLDVLCFALE